MKNKVFGLDIGSQTIKMVWLSKDSKGYFLEAAINSPAPVKGMLSQSPLDEEEMAKAIQTMLKEANISSKYVAVALPENQVYTRVVEMPQLSDKELVSAIYWEAEQYIPIPLNTVTLDYRVLSRPSTPGEKMSVLLVGASTQLVQKYERVLALAGLTTTYIETELLSIIRAIAVGQNFPTSLVLHIGSVNSSIAVIRNGIITFAYSISTGGLAISRAIAADFGFSLTQAEEYKRVYGLSDKTLGGKIGKVSKPILESIVVEMKKALASNNEKYKQDNVRQIILSGGSAKLPGIVTFFTQELGIETTIANPWKILGTQEVSKEVIDNAPDYTIAVGLAMRE